MSLSILDLHKSIMLKLKELYSFEEARAMTDRLFEHYFGLTPAQRVLLGRYKTDEDILPIVNEAVNKLLSNVPLQYVTGKAFFMEMEFTVNQSVLIPRPETEELVGLILKDNRSRKPEIDLQILDIGTGSGCIAISLKRYLPHSKVYAIDISNEALGVAEVNAINNSTEITFIECDILDQSKWIEFPQYDVIVSNPPYVTITEKDLMLPNVVDYEPHTALFVPDNDPFVFYRCILSFAKTKLDQNGSVWFEINEMYGSQIKEIALNQGFREVNIIFDFHGKSRFLHCRK